MFYYLLPSSGISKTARSVISVVLLCSVCLPLYHTFDGEIKIPFIFPEKNDAAIEQPLDFYEETAKKITEKAAADIIRKYTNVPFRFEADIRSSEDGTVEILRISIFFEVMPEHKKEISDELYRELGIIPEIGVKSKND